MISVDDYLFFVDEALDGMVEIVTVLGDELANRRPDLPGANSPYAVLTHRLGVVEYWAGYMVAGRNIERDRLDIAHLEPFAPPRGTPDPEDAGLPLGSTQGGALVHIYEELAQHRGQMEVCRDVLLAPWARVV